MRTAIGQYRSRVIVYWGEGREKECEFLLLGTHYQSKKNGINISNDIVLIGTLREMTSADKDEQNQQTLLADCKDTIEECSK